MKGNTGENLLCLLERRLDNVVYSMGLAPSRSAARQAVIHGHIAVNGKAAKRPGILVRAGDTIQSAAKEKSKTLVKAGIEQSRSIRQVPSWVTVTDEHLQGIVVTLPKRQDVPFDVNELFVVEVCSR
jgi:small subunit ribosomal protein S4